MRNVLSSKTLDRPSGKLPLSRCHVTFGFGSPVSCFLEMRRGESCRLINRVVINERERSTYTHSRSVEPMGNCVHKLNNYVQTNFNSFINLNRIWRRSGLNNDGTKNNTERKHVTTTNQNKYIIAHFTDDIATSKGAQR